MRRAGAPRPRRGRLGATVSCPQAYRTRGRALHAVHSDASSAGQSAPARAEQSRLRRMRSDRRKHAARSAQNVCAGKTIEKMCGYEFAGACSSLQHVCAHPQNAPQQDPGAQARCSAAAAAVGPALGREYEAQSCGHGPRWQHRHRSPSAAAARPGGSLAKHLAHSGRPVGGRAAPGARGLLSRPRRTRCRRGARPPGRPARR